MPGRASPTRSSWSWRIGERTAPAPSQRTPLDRLCLRDEGISEAGQSSDNRQTFAHNRQIALVTKATPSLALARWRATLALSLVGPLDLSEKLPALLSEAVPLLAASGLVGDGHLDEPGIQKGIQDLVPELGAASTSCGGHEIHQRLFVTTLTQDLDLVPTQCLTMATLVARIATDVRTPIWSRSHARCQHCRCTGWEPRPS